MGTFTLDNNLNPLVTQNSDGTINSICWEWRIDALGAVTGDYINTPVFDIENIYLGDNSKINIVPVSAFFHSRVVTSAAHTKILADNALVALPSIDGAGTDAFSNGAGYSFTLRGQLMTRKCRAQLLLAADTTPGANEFIRFGFKFGDY